MSNHNGQRNRELVLGHLKASARALRAAKEAASFYEQTYEIANAAVHVRAAQDIISAEERQRCSEADDGATAREAPQVDRAASGPQSND